MRKQGEFMKAIIHGASIALAMFATATPALAQAQIEVVTDPTAMTKPKPVAVIPAVGSPVPPATSTPDGAGETLDNATVIALVDAGLGSEAIIAKINTSGRNYDTSTNALIALKNANVPDDVIAAMLTRDSVEEVVELDDTSMDINVPHSPGIYLAFPEENRMARLDPTVPSEMKTGGVIGYALTGGIASMKMKVVITGNEARTDAPSRRPEFYFFFNKDHALGGVSQFGSAFSMTAMSPAEFSLVEFKQKKNRREARVGSVGIGGIKAGVRDKDQIGFDFEEVAPGVFRVWLGAGLTPGEYGFVYSMGGATGNGGGGNTRIFDFSID